MRLLVSVAAVAASTLVAAVPLASSAQARSLDALVPQFGVVANTNPNAIQQGSCEGFNGVTTIAIPCFCPPDRATFLQNLTQAIAAGRVLDNPINFSTDATDQSEQTNKQRATACIILLQNFNGTAGVGCPAASAPNLLSQQKTGVRTD